ncbi:hypothetical protein HDU97_003025 [Phlyctochytrium planicorne]|nr:hypothetical protein HDU97_003025 [Phlyctochytrium planicorne]
MENKEWKEDMEIALFQAIEEAERELVSDERGGADSSQPFHHEAEFFLPSEEFESIIDESRKAITSPFHTQPSNESLQVSTPQHESDAESDAQASVGHASSLASSPTKQPKKRGRKRKYEIIEEEVEEEEEEEYEEDARKATETPPPAPSSTASPERKERRGRKSAKDSVAAEVESQDPRSPESTTTLGETESVDERPAKKQKGGTSGDGPPSPDGTPKVPKPRGRPRLNRDTPTTSKDATSNVSTPVSRLARGNKDDTPSGMGRRTRSAIKKK